MEIEDIAGVRLYIERTHRFDQETRTIEFVIHIPDPFVAGTPIDGTDSSSAPPLLIGKFVEVELQGSAPGEHFKIPRLALQYDDEVWVVQEDQTITIVHVDVLQRGHDEVYVAGDLSAGQRVVISGIEVAGRKHDGSQSTTLANNGSGRTQFRSAKRSDRVHG